MIAMNLLSSKEELASAGALYTSKEIIQQPKLWAEAAEIIQQQIDQITLFLDNIQSRHDRIKIIFTGAGTSAFIGDTLLPYLKMISQDSKFDLESIPTTDIVSNPYYHLERDFPVLLISFARSGDSPESYAAVQLVNQLVQNAYHIIITCNKNGELANQEGSHSRSYILLMPEEANDKGFAMTSSFTTMMLSCLLLFQHYFGRYTEKTIEALSVSAAHVLQQHKNSLKAITEQPFKKLIYLGSGVFKGLACEASLKFLELTGGTIPCMYDTSLGFRHGPKTFYDENSAVILFLSSNSYTRNYDLDILKELFLDPKKGTVIVISSQEDDAARSYCDHFLITHVENQEEDIILSFPYIIIAQILALYKSISVGLKPDNPSLDGKVNRVVKGVRIYPHHKFSK